MTALSSYIYSAAIRTRRAELLGLEKSHAFSGSCFLPLFELTRSRRTKTNPEGSVAVSVKTLNEIVGEAHFVADVTTLSSLSNSETERLLDPNDNFSNWVKFVSNHLPRTALPIVHLTDPFDAKSVASQVHRLLRSKAGVAFRIPSEFSPIDELARTIEKVIDDFSAVAIYADVGLVTDKGYRGALARVHEVASLFSDTKLGLFSPLASSFPSTVTPFGDESGSFPLHEVKLSDNLKEEFTDLHCIHGDYACIHPRDLEGTAINWVPRVDVPLDGELFYYRYRRHAGGYTKAAEAALNDARYVPLKCWGHTNIEHAAAGTPDGKAPAFWIATRLNFHIERQLKRLGA